MPEDYSQFEKRKKDHIDLALLQSNQSHELNAFEHISLLHEALPDLNFEDISIKSSRFNQTVTNPFVVSSMTAGHHDAANINRNLISACQVRGWDMGVGSQRRELTDKNAHIEWAPLIKDFPDVRLFSNLGIAQIIHTPIEKIVRLTETLQAKALIIHCNALQECIQPEGTPSFKGCWQVLDNLVKTLSLPVIIKETGCGFSLNTLKRLNEIGVAAVEVSGLGGTHWGRIEGHRASHEPIRHRAASTFGDWGITTVQSVMNAQSIHPYFEIWGSGGVRHGLDAAKLIALGATSICFAKPLLEAALHSKENVLNRMDSIEYELKVAMFCTGSSVLSDLRSKYVIS